MKIFILTYSQRAARQNPQQTNGQQGAALISVLLIFAIITILASQLITRSQLDIERTRWLTTEAQVHQYALAGETLARQILYSKQEALKSEELNISVVPEILPVFQPDHGEIAIEIVDIQGLLNLNNIAESNEHHKILTRLFSDVLQKTDVSPYLMDWIDTDNNPQSGGAEDFAYLSQSPPYRAASRPMISSSELLALPNIGPEDFKKISPFVSAQSKSTAININTAPAEVLAALHPELSASQVINFREQSPPGFTSVESFMASDITAGLNLEAAPLTVKSTHFLVKVMARVNDHSVWLHTRLLFDTEAMKITLKDRTQTLPFLIRVQETTDLTQDGTLANTHL